MDDALLQELHSVRGYLVADGKIGFAGILMRVAQRITELGDELVRLQSYIDATDANAIEAMENEGG